MTYNEPHKVKHLRPRADRQRDAEIAVRRKLVGVKKRYQADDEDDYEEDYGDDEEYEEYTGPLAVVNRRYDTPIAVVTPRAKRIDHYHEEPYFTHAPAKPRAKPHWLVYVGGAFILLLIGWMAYGPITTAWQIHTDDVTYGNPRTFQIDEVVGHNDSNSNPSHFIAENLHGHFFVEEIPGGDISKARFYHFPDDIGNGNLPITISFQDFDNNGRMDMIVKIGDPGSQVTYMMQNDGKQFVNKG